MPVYAYTALDLTDCRTSGTFVADTAADGRQRLRERGLRLLAFAPAKVKRSHLPVAHGSRTRRQEKIAETARYLSLLLHAGVPLAESLDVLARRLDSKLTAVLKDVRDRITGGESLADALAVHDHWFDPLFVSAVRVGQLTGNLDEALCELAEHLQTRQKLHGQLTNALTYPMILLCLGTAVVIFLMSYVVPQLLTVLTASGQPLPAATVLLKGLSDALVTHWLIILSVTGTIVAACTALYRLEAGRRAWHRGQLRLPVLGPLIQKSVVAEFAQHMSLLLRTGVVFIEAIQTVAALTRNRVLADELSAMAKAVESGSDIAPTMAESRIFPPVVAHLVAVGQDSGELPTMFTELKTRFETEVRLATARFTAALEPVLIVVLAATIGFVVFAAENIAESLESQPPHRLRLHVLSLLDQHQAEIVHRHERVRVHLAENAAPGIQRITMDFLSFGVLILHLESHTQVVH